MNDLIRACARIVFGRLLPRLAYPVIRGPLKGAKFILGTLSGEGGGATVYFNMTEPEQTSAFIDTLKNGQVFFDIGANVGYYTILGARIVGSQGKIFAFEPVIRNLAYLYRHTVLNKASNVTIISAACSDTLSLTIFSAGLNFAMGHMTNNIHFANNANGLLFPVPTVTVDAIVQQMGVSPDVMKIDVEGAEHSVLRGAQATLRKAKPKIFLSTHSDMLRSSCLEYLKGFGYTCEVLSQDKNTPSEFLAEYIEI
jgi:FkbM family methyltransferase